MRKKKSNVTITRAEAAPQVIVQQLSIRPVNRQVLEIETWRNAIRSAEAVVPRRTQLIDLYDDIMLDGHLSSVVNKFVKKITNASWEFGKDGKVIDGVNDLIDTPEFEKLLTSIVLSEFWGQKWVLANKFTPYGFNVFEIPQKHIRPKTGIVAKEQSGDSGFNINDGIYAKEVMQFGDPDDLGKLRIVAQYVIYKRGAFGDWSQFAEIFGMPFRKGTYDGYDDAQRVLLEEALEKAGSAAYAVVPAGTNIEFIENKTNSDGAVYKVLKDACNQEISVTILGNTETTTSSESSGYAQSKTHENSEDDLIHAATKRARRLLNRYFIPVMEAGGVNTQGGWFYIKGDDEQVAKKDKFEMHMRMIKELDLPFDAKALYQEYGLPVPADFEAQMAQKAKKAVEIEARTPTPSEDKSTEKEEKKGKKPGEKSLTFSDRPMIKRLLRLADFFQAAPTQIGANQKCQCGEALTINLSDTGAEPFDDEALIRRFWNAGGLLSFDVGLFHRVSGTLSKGLQKGWFSKKSNLVDIGFEYGSDDPALLTSFEMNLHRFSASKTLAEAQKLNELFRKAKSFDEFYTNAKLVTDVFNKEWLLTEYTTALLTGESAATYSRLMQNLETFPYWKLKNVGDNRVRAEHQEYDNLILPANDPRWRKLFPPNGWKCRCYVVGVMAHEVKGVDFEQMRAKADRYLASEEYAKSKAMGWGVNRADIGEVFTADQFYVNKFPGKAAKHLEELKPSDYGLKSYSQAKRAATDVMPLHEGSIDDFFKTGALTDYHNRSILLDHANFDRADQGEGAYRLEQLEALRDTLKNPDEVWIGGELFDQFVTLKYYTNETFAVISVIRNGKIYQVKTWLTILERNNLIDLYRRGLLIFSKP